MIPGCNCPSKPDMSCPNSRESEELWRIFINFGLLYGHKYFVFLISFFGDLKKYILEKFTLISIRLSTRGKTRSPWSTEALCPLITRWGGLDTPFYSLASQDLAFTFLWLVKSWGIIILDLRASAANCAVTCICTCDHVDPDVELSPSLISTKICFCVSGHIKSCEEAEIGFHCSRWTEFIRQPISYFTLFPQPLSSTHPQAFFKDVFIPYTACGLTLPSKPLSAFPHSGNLHIFLSLC